MSSLFRIHESAETEINEAANFYDREDQGLGNLFLVELKRAIEEIIRFPETGSILSGTIRKKNLRGFPFSLYYKVQTEEIRLLAVAHQRRRPFYWRHLR